MANKSECEVKTYFRCYSFDVNIFTLLKVLLYKQEPGFSGFFVYIQFAISNAE